MVRKDRRVGLVFISASLLLAQLIPAGV